MIQGRFSEDDELFFEIELIAADGLELPTEALQGETLSQGSNMNKNEKLWKRTGHDY